MFINKNKSSKLNMFKIMQILNNLCYSQNKIFNIENRCCLKCYFITQQIF